MLGDYGKDRRGTEEGKRKSRRRNRSEESGEKKNRGREEEEWMVEV
jgi:hypothetical protein